jgi:hypothetical protein
MPVSTDALLTVSERAVPMVTRRRVQVTADGAVSRNWTADRPESGHGERLWRGRKDTKDSALVWELQRLFAGRPSITDSVGKCCNFLSCVCCLQRRRLFSCMLSLLSAPKGPTSVARRRDDNAPRTSPKARFAKVSSLPRFLPKDSHMHAWHAWFGGFSLSLSLPLSLLLSLTLSLACGKISTNYEMCGWVARATWATGKHRVLVLGTLDTPPYHIQPHPHQP